MNSMKPSDMQQHVLVLGWLYLIGHAFFLAIGGFIFVLLTGIGVASGDSQAMTVLGIVGTAVGALLAMLAIPGLLAGYGLLAHKPWARVLTIVVGILSLVNFPIGTAMGIYTFWVLTQESATEYFATPVAV